MEKTENNQNIDLYQQYISSSKMPDYDIKSFDTLSKEEQKELIRKAQNDEEKYMEILLVYNLKLIAHIINVYYKNIDYRYMDDVFQFGIIGFLIGARKYNKEEIAFSTWVSYYIRRSVGTKIGKLYYDTTVSDSLIRKAGAYRELTERKKEIGEVLTDEEAKRILKISDTYLKNLKVFLSRKVEYIEQIIDEDEISEDKNPRLIDKSFVLDDDVIENVEAHELLVFLKEMLSPIEYFVLYNLILAKDTIDGQKIANYFYITRESVKQIKARAIKCVRSLIDRDGESLKRKRIQDMIKEREKSNYYNLNTLPINPENIYMFLYLRDSLTELELQVLYERFFGKYVYDRNRLCKNLGISVKELKNIEKSLNELFKKAKRKSDYKIFRDKLINEYHTRIYGLDLMKVVIDGGYKKDSTSLSLVSA